LLDIPPKAITLFLEYFDNRLNLFKPKKFPLSLNIEDKKISFTFCLSFILISLKLCADPISKKFFLKL
jgi:hypothetical protein